MSLKSLKSLERILECPLVQINHIIENIDDYYRPFEKREIKKDGRIKFRKIEPSIGKLKLLQERILKRILEPIKLPPNVQGGIKNRDTISNALVHLGKNYHFCTDIKSFYPSIRYGMVDEMFINNGFSPPVTKILTKLTTYKGKVPQGIPPSTYIANLVFCPIDLELLHICEPLKIHYTRYIDDLVFSSQNCFHKITDEIIRTFETRGFRRSQKKTFYKLGPTEITGILVRQNKLELTDEKIKKLNSDMTIEERKGFENYIKQVLEYEKRKRQKKK